MLLSVGAQSVSALSLTDAIAQRKEARVQTASVKGVADAAITLPTLPDSIRDRINRKPPAAPSNPPQQPPRSSSSSSSSSSTDSSLSSVRARILELVNQARKDNGLPALQKESHLEQAAQKHAEDMKKRNYFSHNTPEGKTPTDQIRDAGYPLNGRWYTGQNIAEGQRSAEEVMKDWMNSSGHRKNILSKNFREIGVGFYQNVWVQDFGAHNL
jgi:uncharacterized protein YkwD